MAHECEVLLVEDNPNDAELSIEALTRAFPADRLVHVEDGVLALEAIFGEQGFVAAGLPPPRVIVLDIKLPRVDGLDVLRRLKADPRTRMIPVMMLTSSKEIQDIAACYGAGANSYVVKPVAYEEYLEKVSDAARYWARINVPPNGA